MEPAEARTVEWFTGGVGLRAIAHRLNAEQIPFPAEPTRRGARRKGWASSAVRVILLNEKYVGRWVYGRRMFVKDPLTGRRQARLRPRAEWQVSEHPDLRLVEPDVWETVQTKFRRQAATYPRSRGRLAGRTAGSPSGRASLFSGVLQCAGCGGTLVVVSGDPHRAERRYGCGFHREKGSLVCANALTVKIATAERRLLEAIRTKILGPEAVRYLITAVNQHLDAFRATEGEARRRLEQGLQQVEEELLNVERAILAGVVSETTAALVQDRRGPHGGWPRGRDRGSKARASQPRLVAGAASSGPRGVSVCLRDRAEGYRAKRLDRGLQHPGAPLGARDAEPGRLPGGSDSKLLPVSRTLGSTPLSPHVGRSARAGGRIGLGDGRCLRFPVRRVSTHI